jgi:hypothetical protein
LHKKAVILLYSHFFNQSHIELPLASESDPFFIRLLN